MNANVDRLQGVGVLVGVFLVLAGLGTLAGTPWNNSETLLVGVGSAVGSVLTVGIGVALAYLVTR